MAKLWRPMKRGARRKPGDPAAPVSEFPISESPASEPNEDAGRTHASISELETYKHAFETTAADRDRLAAELETYRHAFETTVADRDIHKQDALDWKRAVAAFLDADDFKRALAGNSPRRDPLPRSRQRGLPNVFCVGVQKSATSFLYSIIRNHPKITVYPKDISALERLHETRSLAEYTEMVADLDVARPVIAQFEVGFIEYSMTGIKIIKEYLCKNSRIIICVRNPVDRMISEYKMRVRTIRGNGTFVENYDFKDALALERDRSVHDSREYRNHFAYTERSKYSKKINTYIKAFGRENVHIVVMESDFTENTNVTLVGIFDFFSLLDEEAFKLSLLGHDRYREATRAPSEIEVIFHLADGRRIRNPTGMEKVAGRDVVQLEVRSDVPAQLDINRDDPLPELLASAIHLKRRLTYEPSREEKRRLFDTYFRDDVARLEKLLGRDLSVWYGKYDDEAGTTPR